MSEPSFVDYANELKRITNDGRMAEVNDLIISTEFINAVSRYGFELLKLFSDLYRESFKDELGNPKTRKVLVAVITNIAPMESHLTYLLPKTRSPIISIEFADMALVIASRLECNKKDAFLTIVKYVRDSLLNLPIPSDPKRFEDEDVIGRDITLVDHDKNVICRSQNTYYVTDLYATLRLICTTAITGFENEFFCEATRALAGPVLFYYLEGDSELDLKSVLASLFKDYFARNVDRLLFSKDNYVERNRLSASLPMVFYFFAQDQELRARIPAIYNPLYVFRILSEVAVSVGNLEHCGAQEKFLTLMEYALGLIDGHTITPAWFHAKLHQSLSKNLGWHAVYGFTRDIRDRAIKLVLLYASRLDDECRYLWFLHVSSVSGHINYHEFILNMFREYFLKAIKGIEGRVEYFKNEKLFAVMRAFCELKNDSESGNVLISTELHYAAKLLNLFILVFHWDRRVNLGAASNVNFCEILKKYISDIKERVNSAKKFITDFEEGNIPPPQPAKITLSGPYFGVDDDTKAEIVMRDMLDRPSGPREDTQMEFNLIEFHIRNVSNLYGLE